MFRMIQSDFYRIIKGKLLLKSFCFLTFIAAWKVYYTDAKSATDFMAGQLSGMSTLICIFFINILLVTWSNEFSQRTVNQSLIFGFKRSQYYFGKFLTGCLLSILMISVFFLLLLVGTAIKMHAFPIIFVLKTVGMQLPIYLAVLASGYLIFSLVDQPHLPIVVFLLMTLLGENFLVLIVSEVNSNWVEKMEHLLLFNNLSALVGMKNVASNVLAQIYGSAFAVFSICTLGSLALFKTKELK